MFLAHPQPSQKPTYGKGLGTHRDAYFSYYGSQL